MRKNSEKPQKKNIGSKTTRDPKGNPKGDPKPDPKLDPKLDPKSILERSTIEISQIFLQL